MKKSSLKISLLLLSCLLTTKVIFSQAALQPWGNLQGIRIDGQLMEFDTRLDEVYKNWSGIQSTGKERQHPKYSRNGNQQIVTTRMDSLYFNESVRDVAKGEINIDIQLNAKASAAMEGVYLSMALPGKYYNNGSVQLNNLPALKLSATASALDKYLEPAASSVRFIAANRQLQIILKSPAAVLIKNEMENGMKGVRIFIPIQKGDIQHAQTINKNFTIKASGLIDKKPVVFALNTTATGRVFNGLGGNFRLQNQATDQQVIDYCLKNLRVAWGRVEMPWQLWQPIEDTSGIEKATSGKLDVHVRRAMEMAQRLYKMGMPVIVTAWFPPAWAVVGKLKPRPGPDGIWGNPLDTTKTRAIYASIADYIQYLKEQYGVEVAVFSFNESDLGINVRQTGEEHAALIKGLGAYFVSRGLKTKLVLGDNSDATTYQFIYPALNDPATYPYIGAISFHSWRGWDAETLQKWADAADKLKLPLLVGEGSIDAAAWAYPAIFNEQIYSLEEINLYVRLLSICQPASILQWQLTADYSPLAGGGIFGDTTTLHPLQRFWNLKQLAATPADLKAMQLKCSGDNISCAALGDNEKGVYAIHIVNSGAKRNAVITGIPTKISTLHWIVTKGAFKIVAIKKV